MRSLANVLFFLCIGSLAGAAASAGQKTNGVHHHRQFRRRTGRVSPSSACIEVPAGEIARSLDDALGELVSFGGRRDDVGHAAVRACMGSTEAHARVLMGLVSPADADVRIAQVYLHHRPIADVNELRAATAAIAHMSESEAQVRALDVLAQHYLSDRESLDTLTQLFSKTQSWPVQNAIAGVLIRADSRSIVGPQLLRRLHEDRLKSSVGDTMVDALIRRLQLP